LDIAAPVVDLAANRSVCPADLGFAAADLTAYLAAAGRDLNPALSSAERDLNFGLASVVADLGLNRSGPLSLSFSLFHVGLLSVVKLGLNDFLAGLGALLVAFLATFLATLLAAPKAAGLPDPTGLPCPSCLSCLSGRPVLPGPAGLPALPVVAALRAAPVRDATVLAAAFGAALSVRLSFMNCPMGLLASFLLIV
jgi:hypothetical protein